MKPDRLDAQLVVAVASLDGSSADVRPPGSRHVGPVTATSRSMPGLRGDLVELAAVGRDDQDLRDDQNAHRRATRQRVAQRDRWLPRRRRAPSARRPARQVKCRARSRPRRDSSSRVDWLSSSSARPWLIASASYGSTSSAGVAGHLGQRRRRSTSPRRAARHRFEHRHAEALVQRREHEDRRRAVAAAPCPARGSGR